MKAERLALLFVIVLVIGMPLAAALARSTPDTIEIHAQMADNGGWTPSALTAQVGQTLHLRLTSDDVVHSFAVGQSALPAIDVLPGQWATTTLTFNQPGKYTFYCTRWCGPNHWRMRGTIEVTGTTSETITTTPPLYVTLNLDLDAPHPSDLVPGVKPSAMRGAALGVKTDQAAEPDRTQSPAQLWQALKSSSGTAKLSDLQIWDLIALTYRARTTPEQLAEGRQLYQQNCAELDEPPVLLGKNQGTNPVEYLLVALSGCLTTSMIAHAAAKGIEIKGVQSRYEGDIDLRAFLGISEDVPVGYQKIRIYFKIDGNLSAQQKEELVRMAQKYSPVFNTIAKETPISAHLET